MWKWAECAICRIGTHVSMTLHKVLLGLSVSAELHIVWIAPSSRFSHSLPLRVIQSSGLVLD